MANRAIRVGIDVGGTHTKAVAIDNETHEIIGKGSVMTTHDDEMGVATGVIEAFKLCLTANNIDPNDVGSYLGQENLEIGGDGLGSNDEVSATVTKEYIGDAYGFSFELHVYNNLAHKDTSKNYYIDDGSGNTSFPDLDINFDLDDFPPDMELPDLDVLPDLDQLPEISGDGNIQFDGNSSFEFAFRQS